MLPCIALSKADAAPVLCIRERAVPASIADMLKLFFALLLGALRLGAMPPLRGIYYLRLSRGCPQLPQNLKSVLKSVSLILKYTPIACSITCELVNLRPEPHAAWRWKYNLRSLIFTLAIGVSLIVTVSLISPLFLPMIPQICYIFFQYFMVTRVTP